MNPVLNREVRRTGGRVLITLGDQDIDLSPSFTIFLSTRDPSVEFPPDLCSRVTFVNFTVTRSSLQSQCLNRVSVVVVVVVVSVVVVVVVVVFIVIVVFIRFLNQSVLMLIRSDLIY